MEFLTFIQQRQRMCDSIKDCSYCPLEMYSDFCAEETFNMSDKKYKAIEKAVEKWVKEHPVITNAQKFDEVMRKYFGSPYPKGVDSANIKGDNKGFYKGIVWSEKWDKAEYIPPNRIEN